MQALILAGRKVFARVLNGVQAPFVVLLLIGIAPALPSAAVAEDDGASLYKLHCARCHGEDGAAKTDVRQRMEVANLRSDEVQKRSDNELFDSIALGVRHKQYPHTYLYRGLAEAQIRKLVAYIRELPKTKK
jgi:cytochrome c553